MRTFLFLNFGYAEETSASTLIIDCGCWETPLAALQQFALDIFLDWAEFNHTRICSCETKNSGKYCSNCGKLQTLKNYCDVAIDIIDELWQRKLHEFPWNPCYIWEIADIEDLFEEEALCVIIKQRAEHYIAEALSSIDFAKIELPQYITDDLILELRNIIGDNQEDWYVPKLANVLNGTAEDKDDYIVVKTINSPPKKKASVKKRKKKK